MFDFFKKSKLNKCQPGGLIAQEKALYKTAEDIFKVLGVEDVDEQLKKLRQVRGDDRDGSND